MEPAAERLFGWTAAEAIGRRIQDLVLGTAEQNEEGGDQRGRLRGGPRS